MKKLLAALAVVLVLVVGAVLALPALVPAERIQAEVVAQVKAATGRDLTIDGKLSVSVLPSLSVQVANVALSNPPGFSTKDMVRLGALDVRLKLLPLLSGSVEVDSFVLVDPLVTLEVDRKGNANWVFGETKQPATPAKPAEGKSGAGAGPAEIRLGEVAIRNGKLVYIDGAAGTREEVSGIDLEVSLPSLAEPMKAKGGLTWRGEAVALAVDVARPKALLEGATSAAAITLSARPVSLSFKGEASQAAAKGELDLSVASVRDLAKWATGKPLEMAGSGLGPFGVKGQLSAQGAKVALTQATIALDAIRAGGDLAVDGGGARPKLTGRLAVETLDINPYLPPEEKGKPTPASAGAGGGTTAKSDWSDEPIDASGLKAADVDFTLSVGAIKVRALEIGKSALHLVLNNGRMTADLTELALYKGAGKGRLVVDGGQPGVGLDTAFDLKGLQAAPFLAAAAGFDRIEGTASADLKVSGRGRTERQLVSSLAGNGAVMFLDGAIKGINLAAMVRNVTTAFSDTSGTQKTDFAELGGSWTMANGIVT
ncbi:MAG: AsmA family protein, partial [Pseudomonadota bacterium]